LKVVQIIQQFNLVVRIKIIFVIINIIIIQFVNNVKY